MLGMILGRNKTIAALAATAIVASGAMWAPAAQAATNCVPVPGGTIGSDVKVGPIEDRVPAISNIVICAGGGTVPLARVATSGGTCTSSCISVYVGGDTLDLDGASISWSEDGVAQPPVGLNPPAIPAGGEVCVLSAGFPDAPDTECTIAIGPDDPTGVVQPVVDEANEIVADVLGRIDGAGQLTCDQVPEWYDPNTGSWADFCTDPAAWSFAVTNGGTDLTCGTLPVMYDDWGTPYEFCENPTGWTNAFVDDTYETCNYALGPQYDENWWDYVYFCDDPVRWTELALRNLCGNLCNPQTLQVLIATIRELSEENIQIHIG
jgi:hypothetical protein